MAISQGNTNLTLGEIRDRVSEPQILAHYLGVTRVPTVINSPLREDKNPSFGIYSPDGKKIRFKDLATGESGSIFILLEKLWNLSFLEVLNRVVKEVDMSAPKTEITVTRESTNTTTYSGNTKLDVKVRDWRKYDEEYWDKYGIPISLLKKAHAYPISHYIITKDSRRMVFGADKLAYAYVENKEDSTTIKVYQPYNKSSFKWINKHDRSVLGLWTMMPQKGELLCICSSVKDALCLTANTGIPAICLQGEGYGISKTAQDVLRNRFDKIYILFDNDSAGLYDGEKLAESTGFTNIILPQFEGGKDISDYYSVLEDKTIFKTTITKLFNS